MKFFAHVMGPFASKNNKPIELTDDLESSIEQFLATNSGWETQTKSTRFAWLKNKSNASVRVIISQL